MPTEEWDDESFRRRMVVRSSQALNYANEHKARVRRGQSNGSLAVAKQYEGESFICDTLSTCAEASAPSALLRRLDAQAEAIVELNKDENYRRGYLSAIRDIRRSVERHLQDG